MNTLFIEKLRQYLDVVKTYINANAFHKIFGKEAPRLSELESLTTKEVSDRTFSVCWGAGIKFLVAYVPFMLAISYLIEHQTFQYISTICFGMIFMLLHILLKVGYSTYCELKHENMKKQLSLF
jgi:uncharacterized membrane protein (DUF485 family)